VVQALATAKLQFQLGEENDAMASLDEALGASKRILSELVEDSPGMLRRSA
jgi:hypothetical protein